MWKLLVKHNMKSGYNCDCVSAPNVGHVLFECPIIETIWKTTLAKCSERNSDWNDQVG